MPAATLSGTAWRQRLHDRIGELVAGAEAGDRRRREDRIGEAALGRDDPDRAREAAVLRDRPWTALSSRTERSVSQIAQSTVPSNGMLIGRSFTCGAVPVRSTVISSPSTMSVTTIGRLAPRGSSLVEKAVDSGLGAVDAVGQCRDRVAHQPLGVVHQVVRARRHASRPLARAAARENARRRSGRPRSAPPCRRRRGRGHGCCRAACARRARSAGPARRP